MTDKTHILSQDPRQAVEEMIKISEELVARIETESSSVATNDGTTFTMNEMNKEGVANMYHQAANEFRARLGEFKSVDKSLINKLNDVQESLGQSTKNNLALLEKIEEARQEEDS